MSFGRSSGSNEVPSLDENQQVTNAAAPMVETQRWFSLVRAVRGTDPQLSTEEAACRLMRELRHLSFGSRLDNGCYPDAYQAVISELDGLRAALVDASGRVSEGLDQESCRPSA